MALKVLSDWLISTYCFQWNSLYINTNKIWKIDHIFSCWPWTIFERLFLCYSSSSFKRGLNLLSYINWVILFVAWHENFWNDFLMLPFLEFEHKLANIFFSYWIGSIFYHQIHYRMKRWTWREWNWWMRSQHYMHYCNRLGDKKNRI